MMGGEDDVNARKRDLVLDRLHEVGLEVAEPQHRRPVFEAVLENDREVVRIASLFGGAENILEVGIVDLRPKDLESRRLPLPVAAVHPTPGTALVEVEGLARVTQLAVALEVDRVVGLGGGVRDDVEIEN